MLKLFGESTQFRDELFQDLANSNIEIDVVDRLVFECIAASTPNLSKLRMPETLTFQRLNKEWLKQPFGRSTLGGHLKELKSIGCNEQLIVLYAFWLSSTFDERWKQHILPYTPNVNSLKQ